MPLSRNVGANIRELTDTNKAKPADEKRPRAQIVAIALHVAGKKSASGQKPPKRGH